jgi:hypothetical protein
MSLSSKIKIRKFCVILAVIVLLFIVVAPAAAITWGADDGNGHPNVGLISIAQGPFCSGTLIHPRVFLTAGHCTSFLEELIGQGGLPIDAVKVSFNTQNALVNDLLAVENIITHPAFASNANSNPVTPASNPRDVGVLILAEPVVNIAPADLPYEGFLDDLNAAGILGKGSDKAKFTLVGYGTTLEWPPPEIIFPDGKRRVALSEFQTLLKAWLRLSQNNATDDGGTCAGDSGGPAFWAESDGTEILVGITSWGDAQCVATGFNYRVDISDTLSFISAVIEALP